MRSRPAGIPALARCLAVAACVACTAGGASHAAETAIARSPHLRTVGRIADGARSLAERSPTFRALVETLEASDLIVHVTAQSDLPPEVDGRIQFAAAAGGRRYVRVILRADLDFWRRASVLAHELQHAKEIAERPDVTTAAAMEALYREIGFDIRPGQHDTAAACLIGQQVMREIVPGWTAGNAK